jgi:multiple sugar transport system ATP-binding protein
MPVLSRGAGRQRRSATVGVSLFNAQIQVGIAAAPDHFIDIALDLERTRSFDRVSGIAI